MLRMIVPKARPNTLLVLVIAVSMVALGGPSAAGAASPGTFTLVVSPDTVGIGSANTFSAVVTNTGSASMGSVDLSAPLGSVISSVGSTQGTLSFSGRVVSVRDLGIAPSSSFTITVVAAQKCNAHAELTWGVKARTGSDFTGAAFDLKGAGSSKALHLTGSCSLAFVTADQPTDAVENTHITNTPFDTGGGPVQVELLDASNNLVTGFSAKVTVAIDANPGGGTLKGKTSAKTSGGVASYSKLSIDQPGDPYTLVATSPGALSDTSDPFAIGTVALVQSCPPNEPCSGTVSADDGTSASIEAPGGEGGVLTMGLVPDGIDCDGYTEHSGTLVFSLTTDQEKQVTISYDMGDSEFDLYDFQVCYESPTFTLDLLPECYSDYSSYDYYSEAPCVLDRSEDGSIVSITFLAPAGDPKGRV